MDISLKQAFDLFIFDRETYCSHNTVSNYRNTLKYFFDYLVDVRQLPLDQIMLDTVTTNDLKSYVVMLRNREKLENHPMKPTEHKHITNTTIRTYSIDLRTFFNFLYDNDYMDKNIMKKFKLIKREKKLILPLFRDEVERIDALFNLKTVSGLRNYLIVHVMLEEGLRSGEVCALDVSNINFNNNHIMIFDGKGNKDRIIPLSRGLKKYLHQYITLYRPYVHGSDCLFVNVDGSGNRITQDTIKALFSRIRTKAEVDRVHPHLLRHTFATSFILGGGDLESLRIYLGHSSYDVTQNYLHLANTYSRMGSDVYKLDNIFFKSYY